MDLRTRSQQACIETNRSKRRNAVGGIYPLQCNNLPWSSDADVVIAYHAPKPLQITNPLGLQTGRRPIRAWLIIPAAHAPYRTGAFKTRRDSLKPIGVRDGVIISDCQEICLDRAQSPVHGANHSRLLDSDNLHRQVNAKSRECLHRLGVTVANNDDDLFWPPVLPIDTRQTSQQIIRASVRGNEHRNAQ
jgi:hypothetical protein